MDETTTETTVQDSGDTTIVSQPESTDESAAVETTETSDVQETPQEVQSEPSDDEQLDNWAKNKGLELDSDNTRKAAKMAREAERAMHAKAKQKSELEQSLVNEVQDQADAAGLGDDERVLVRQLAVKQTVRDFFDSNPDAKDFEAKMVELVQTKPHLAGDLEALYAVALKDSGRDTTLKSEGGREALESLKSKQMASAPKGAAVNPVGSGNSKITSENVNELVGQNDLKWYEAHREEINAAMAG